MEEGRRDETDRQDVALDNNGAQVKPAVPPHFFISTMVGGCLLPPNTQVYKSLPIPH
jgi:hypothetical protein